MNTTTRGTTRGYQPAAGPGVVGGRQYTEGAMGWTANAVAELLADRSAGVPYKVLAKRHGRKPGTVQSAARYYGAPRVRNHAPGWIRQRVAALAGPGVTDTDIAAATGYSRPRVAEVRKELGIPAGVTAAEGGRRGAATKRARRLLPRCFNCPAVAPAQSHIGQYGWEVRTVRTDGVKVRVTWCPACKSNPACLATVA